MKLFEIWKPKTTEKEEKTIKEEMKIQGIIGKEGYDTGELKYREGTENIEHFK